MKCIVIVRAVVYLAIYTLINHAYAGALGRSGQSIKSLFEDGQVFQYYQGHVSPDVEGQDSLGQSTGGVSKSYILVGAAVKTDINDDYALAIIVDQPWGADFGYNATSQLYGGTRAEADSLAITSLVAVKLPGGLSLYGGPRLQQFSGSLALNGLAYGPLAGYTMTSDDDWALGYAAGLAYEIRAYAMRVSFTYSSPIDHELAAQESISVVPTTTKITTPQSVNITFQTGVAKNTLLFGSLRWVNWRDFEFQPGALGFTVSTFKDDSMTYVLGSVYRFSPTWSGSLMFRHEPKAHTTNSLFRPTNGYTGLVVSGTYTTANKMRLSAGLSYTRPGDASAETRGGNGVSFSGSESLGLGLRLSVPF